MLQNVVLRHLRNRFSDVRVLNAVLRTGQVRHLGVFNVCAGPQLVDSGADRTAVCGDRYDGSADIAQRGLRVRSGGQVVPVKPRSGWSKR